MTLVVDASVAAAVIFREPAAELCHPMLLRERRIFVPPLFSVELANVGRSKVLRRLLSWDEAALCLREVASWSLGNVDVDWSDAWAIARSSGLTLYDAIYVAAARKRRCRLLTLDVQIREACRHDCVTLD